MFKGSFSWLTLDELVHLILAHAQLDAVLGTSGSRAITKAEAGDPAGRAMVMTRPGSRTGEEAQESQGFRAYGKQPATLQHLQDGGRHGGVLYLEAHQVPAAGQALRPASLSSSTLIWWRSSLSRLNTLPCMWSAPKNNPQHAWLAQPYLPGRGLAARGGVFWMGAHHGGCIVVAHRANDGPR